MTLENGEIRDVTGYTCKRGHDYARKEVTNPTRIVTSTVRLTGSATGAAVVSCKTAQDIPKGKIFEIVAALRQVTAHAPVKIGDVLLTKRRRNGRRYRCDEKCTVIRNEVRRKFTNPFGFVHSSDMIGRYTHTRKQANLFFPLFSFFFLFYTNETSLPRCGRLVSFFLRTAARPQRCGLRPGGSGEPNGIGVR